MGLKGIGQPVQQGISLAAVVGLILRQRRQAAALAQLVEPAATPGAAFKHAVQIGAGHHAALGAVGLPMAQVRVARQGLQAAGRHRGADAAVQLEALQAEALAWPK